MNWLFLQFHQLLAWWRVQRLRDVRRYRMRTYCDELALELALITSRQNIEKRKKPEKLTLPVVTNYDEETRTETMTKNEEPQTLADLEAFLYASGLTLRIGATGRVWTACIARGPFLIAQAANESFLEAVNQAMANSIAELEQSEQVLREPQDGLWN